MKIIERKPVPLYQTTCEECQSVIEYKAGEVSYSHIVCPVCGKVIWASTMCPTGWEDTEDGKT